MKTIADASNTDSLSQPQQRTTDGERPTPTTFRHSAWNGDRSSRKATIAVLIALSAIAMAGLGGCATGPQHPEATAERSASPWWRTDEAQTVHGDPWERLANRFSMPLPGDAAGHARIRQHIEFYRSNSNVLTVSLARAEPWVDHLLGEIERRDLPGELFLVPVIESGFAPEATSPSRAAGIWQFMPATGAHFGLRQTSDFDGRRDVFASTDAALEYLETLYNRFGDWALALAAYNFGQGNVARAIEANARAGRGTDYWSLRLSPAAMDYVPKILALRHLIETRERHGLDLPKPRPENAVVAMPIDTAIDLRQVAALADVPLDDLRSLNPATRSTILRPVPGAHLALPRSAVDSLAANGANGAQNEPAARLPATSRERLEAVRVALQNAAVAPPAPASTANAGRSVSTTTATGPTREIVVAQGDTLSAIAARHGTSVAALKRDNQLQSDHLRVGQRLRVGGSASGSTGPREHIVQPGETLWSIAARHGVDLGELGEVNALARGAILTPGQRLVLPNAIADDPLVITYLVQPGDTLSAVARRHGVSLDSLREHNHLPGDRLRSGDTLVIPRRS